MVYWVVFLFGMALPFDERVSNILLIVLLGYALYQLVINKASFQNYGPVLTIPCVYLISRIYGVFTGEMHQAFDDIMRFLPLIILPFLAVVSTNKGLIRAIMLGTLSGILIFFAICEYAVFQQVITEGGTLDLLFNWRHLNAEYIQPIGTHPSYLALLTNLTLWYIIQHYSLSRLLTWVAVIVLLYFEVKLLSRAGLFVSICIIGFSVFKHRNIWLFAGMIIGVGTFALLIFTAKSNYLRDKFVHAIEFQSSEKADKRFERMQASFFAFDRSPILGVGPGHDEKYRQMYYEEMGYETALKHNYNAHNQFVEELTAYGIVGLLLFMAFLVGTWIIGGPFWDGVAKGMLLIVILSMQTESILERSLGIKAMAIVLFIAIQEFKGLHHEWNLFDRGRS